MGGQTVATTLGEFQATGLAPVMIAIAIIVELGAALEVLDDDWVRLTTHGVKCAVVVVLLPMSPMSPI